MNQIRFGMFIMPFHDPAKPIAQSLDEDLELICLAEEMGFEEFWVGEHHTLKYEPIVMPEIFIGRALADTSRIRIGPAPACVNIHHPAHMAGRLAFLDHLSKGRLNLLLGSSSVTADQELYGVHPKEAAARSDEAIDMILKLWESEPPYHLEGKFWQIHLEENVDMETMIGYIHKPLQRPHPPISIPGMSRNSSSMRMAGERGFAPYAHCLVPGNVVADLFQTYEKGAASAGRSVVRTEFRLARSIFVADTTTEAEQIVRSNSLGKNYEYIGLLFDKGIGRKIYKRDLDMPDSECGLEYLMTEQIIAGDVDQVVKRLLAVYEECGGFGILNMMSYDWDDKQRWVRSMELFSREVMPALNKAVGA